MSARPRPVVHHEPLRIRVDEHTQALVLTRRLARLGSVELHPHAGRWELSLDCPKTDRLVVRVLDAVRRTLAGEPSATAQVLLDGHTYHMHGE